MRRALTVLGLVFALAVAVPVGSEAAKLITGKQIKDGTITSDDVKDKSLTTTDFKPGTLKPGPAGPRGPAGQDGGRPDEVVQWVASHPGGGGTEVRLLSEDLVPPGTRIVGLDLKIAGDMSECDPPSTATLGVGEQLQIGTLPVNPAVDVDPSPRVFERVLSTGAPASPLVARVVCTGATAPAFTITATVSLERLDATPTATWQ